MTSANQAAKQKLCVEMWCAFKASLTAVILINFLLATVKMLSGELEWSIGEIILNRFHENIWKGWKMVWWECWELWLNLSSYLVNKDFISMNECCGCWIWPLNSDLWQPAVLDNLLTSMKFVLHGMGVLRINLANNRNKVVVRIFLFFCLFFLLSLCFLCFNFSPHLMQLVYMQCTTRSPLDHH